MLKNGSTERKGLLEDIYKCEVYLKERLMLL